MKETDKEPETEKADEIHSTIFHAFLRSDELPAADRNIEHFTDEAQTLVGAGQITTATTLAAITFHVLDNPEVLRRLKEELAEAMPNPRLLPTLPKLEQLEYLNAVITEGHRMNMAVPHRLQRVSSDEPIVYKKIVFPPGTPVGMSILCMHTNPTLFPEPHLFRPERFLGHNPEALEAKRRLVPFGKGKRSCLGRELGQAELYYTLAAVFRRFDFELVDTTRADVEPRRDYGMSLPRKGSEGPKVYVK
jgi:cytochrome P450